ncbi:hypothetical protein QYE76_054335 [Lolium multiflorum]|uniref:Integrase catalytic domain-containing protein n=1 Tax=Lolium multiflorum TaxID=4521 RepID=A0AAD8WL97_LOLMU|nr:hypothetical protein QYE76_054335 [Lolium multiflorum]
MERFDSSGSGSPPAPAAATPSPAPPSPSSATSPSPSACRELSTTAANFFPWKTYFGLLFREYDLLDHVDGTIDLLAMPHDPEWLAIDATIIRWFYQTVSNDIFRTVVRDGDSPHDHALHTVGGSRRGSRNAAQPHAPQNAHLRAGVAYPAPEERRLKHLRARAAHTASPPASPAAPDSRAPRPRARPLGPPPGSRRRHATRSDRRGPVDPVTSRPTGPWIARGAPAGDPWTGQPALAVTAVAVVAVAVATVVAPVAPMPPHPRLVPRTPPPAMGAGHNPWTGSFMPTHARAAPYPGIMGRVRPPTRRSRRPSCPGLRRPSGRDPVGSRAPDRPPSAGRMVAVATGSWTRRLRAYGRASRDVWTSPVPSNSGYNYYLVILDDYSHFVWTFPLRRKSDVAATLTAFFAFVSTQFGRPIHALQTDNGKEFDNITIRSLLATHGAIFRLTCPYTSSQNGRAERMLRTLNGCVRTLHSMPPCPRDSAGCLAMATLLVNIRPCRVRWFYTPHHLLYGAPPTYDDLRIFGCRCYPNTAATAAHKLAPRSLPCVFLGYRQHQGLPLLRPGTHGDSSDDAPAPAGPLRPRAADRPRWPSKTPSPASSRLRRAAATPAAPPRPRRPLLRRPRRPGAPVARRGPWPLACSHARHVARARPLGCATLPFAATTPRRARPPARAAPLQRRPRPLAAAPLTLPPSPALHRPAARAQGRPRALLVATRAPPARTAGHAHIAHAAAPFTGTVKRGPRRLAADLLRQCPPRLVLPCATRIGAAMREGMTRCAQSDRELVPAPSRQRHLRQMGLQAQARSDGTQRYKARWVVLRLSARVDFTDTFARLSNRARSAQLHLAASRAWPVHQMDVSNAFLHGHLQEQVYCQQPIGFVDTEAPLGFRSTRSDASLFVYRTGHDMAYLLLYVDDIILTASTAGLLRQLTDRLRAEFALKDLGPLHYFLGIEVVRRADGFFLHQRKYAHELLERAGMLNCNPTPVDTKAKLSASDGSLASDAPFYRSIVGALQYLTPTRPELQTPCSRCACICMLLGMLIGPR